MLRFCVVMFTEVTRRSHLFQENEMSETVIFENEFFTLKYHDDTKIVHHECHQYLFGDELRNCLNRGLEVLAEHHAAKWLSDDRKTSALTPDDGKWSENEWAPKAFRNGWRYWAIVLPGKTVGKMAYNRIVRDPGITERLTVKVFSDPNEAYDWLKEQ